MMTGFRPFSRALQLAGLVAVVVAFSQVRAGDDAKKLPEGVTEITKEHLTTKVPNFFYFDYQYEPSPGKRLWLRVDDKHFVERYPDGSDSRFEILGHAKARGMTGTIVVKNEGDLDKTATPNDGSFQVFIPDKGNEEMVILFRYFREGQGEWLEVDQAKKPILQKVE
jgi:hypothetical protein